MYKNKNIFFQDGCLLFLVCILVSSTYEKLRIIVQLIKVFDSIKGFWGFSNCFEAIST